MKIFFFFSYLRNSRCISYMENFNSMDIYIYIYIYSVRRKLWLKELTLNINWSVHLPAFLIFRVEYKCNMNYSHKCCVKFEILMAVTEEYSLLVVTLCSLETAWRFTGTYRLHHQGWEVSHARNNSEDEGCKFLRIVSKLHNITVVQWLRLALSRGPSTVCVSPDLRTETDPVSETPRFSSNYLESGRWRKSKNPVTVCCSWISIVFQHYIKIILFVMLITVKCCW
jgi:hypothetical protein